MNGRTVPEIALILLLIPGILFADAISTATPDASTSPRQDSSSLTPADAQFFLANPDALRVAGQTNTWYENAGGVVWIVVTVAAIAFLVSVT